MDEFQKLSNIFPKYAEKRVIFDIYKGFFKTLILKIFVNIFFSNSPQAPPNNKLGQFQFLYTIFGILLTC